MKQQFFSRAKDNEWIIHVVFYIKYDNLLLGRTKRDLFFGWGNSFPDLWHFHRGNQGYVGFGTAEMFFTTSIVAKPITASPALRMMNVLGIGIQRCYYSRTERSEAYTIPLLNTFLWWILRKKYPTQGIEILHSNYKLYF